MAIETKVKEEAEGDFTSMIDVVFLLLIFFILQPFKDPDRRVLTYLPKVPVGDGDELVPPTPPINLKIFGSGDKVTFFLDNDEVRDGNYLAGTLISKAGGDTSVPINVTPSSAVNFKHVLKALDQCAIVDMQKVNFTAGDLH